METLKIQISNLINLIKTNDKVKHLLCNFIIVIAFGLMFNPAIGLGLALVVSLLKEVYDEYRENGTGWDWNDIVADIIGIMLGLIFVL